MSTTSIPSKRKQRYVERYWNAAELEKAKFRAADICRYLRSQDSYTPSVTAAVRVRLTARTLPKRKATRSVSR